MARRFDLYRYQILPISRKQMRLFDKPISPEELKAKKNAFFMQTLNRLVDDGQFSYREHLVNHRALHRDADIVIIQLNISRGRVPVETEDFTKEKFVNYPNFIVGFNNRDDSQFILIEREYKAFRFTHIAAKMLEDNLNSAIEDYLLHIEINAVFDTGDFWELIRKYPSIYHVEFELVAPNLTNIHGEIEDSIEDWFPNTNATTIGIEMNSDKQSNLNLEPGVEPTTSFANVASRGGGNIILRAKEVDYTITTKEFVKRFQCKELDVEADGTVKNLDELIELLESKAKEAANETT